jgi:hypothetical protein
VVKQKTAVTAFGALSSVLPTGVSAASTRTSSRAEFGFRTQIAHGGAGGLESFVRCLNLDTVRSCQEGFADRCIQFAIG